LWFIKIFPTQAKGSLRSIVHRTFDMALGEPVVAGCIRIDEQNGERIADRWTEGVPLRRAANLRSHRISVVQATESRSRSNRACALWADSDWPTRWRILREPQMRSVLMVVAHVLSHKSSQVSLIEDDHVIEQISSATSHPALRNPVLPRAAKSGADGLTS